MKMKCFFVACLVAVWQVLSTAFAQQAAPETPSMDISDGIFPEGFSYVGLFEVEDTSINVFDFTAKRDGTDNPYQDLFGFEPDFTGAGYGKNAENTAKRVVYVDSLSDMVRTDVWQKIGHHFMANNYGRLQLVNMIKEQQDCFIGGSPGPTAHMLLTVIATKDKVERDGCIDGLLSFGLGIGSMGPGMKTVAFEDMRSAPDEHRDEIDFTRKLVQYATCQDAFMQAQRQGRRGKSCRRLYDKSFKDYLLPWALPQ